MHVAPPRAPISVLVETSDVGKEGTLIHDFFSFAAFDDPASWSVFVFLKTRHH
jgi:hypothetical protein